MDELDKIIYDIYTIGRTDYVLNVDDLTELKPGIIKKLNAHYLNKYLELLPKPLDNYTDTDMEDWQKGWNAAIDELTKRLKEGQDEKA